MADTTIDLLKNSSYVAKMDELIAAVKLGGSATSDVEWNDVKNKPTTIGGYGITDAKIDNGTITLGANSITPLTTGDIHTALNRTNAVNVANSNYTTYMARGEALFSTETTPTVNGCIAWVYG